MSDCSKAPECALLGREACSLDSPENTCGACRTVPVGNRTDEWGNDSCVTVSVSNILPLASTASCCKVSGTDSEVLLSHQNLLHLPLCLILLLTAVPIPVKAF
ncbi:hypothetical protein GBAR_LOCUS11218 [Geodia barretti]|uniref:Uncharacterized protein n=1 Tax=Geodia barretti TaxID=519541 RepID=A0AA35RXZ6_GEOBA|nr:hypothetical protein GBAR_LOCUS11218 [Geodia barretti]